MMKKTLISFAIAGLLLGASTASAATTTPSVDQLIAQLKEQILSLNTQLAALKAAQANVSTSKQSVNETLKLIGSLKEGMTGEQVILLQTALAADTSVYPEGKVTGYYGKLTTQAIKRFQKKHGLDMSGSMSSSTIARLNKVLEDNHVSREDDDRDEHKGKLCIPPGHTIASGWLKKEREKENRGKGNGTIKWEDRDLILPLCSSKGSTTPIVKDTTAPTFTSVSTTGISATGATVTWTTNEAATAALFLGTSSPVSTTSNATWSNGVFTTTQSATLTGLSANTVYYYVLVVKDMAGNKTVSAQGTFTTGLTPDTTAPVISALGATPTSSTTATVTWTTNEAASSKIYFGTTTPVATSSATALFDGTLVTAHSMSIAGLSASTTYRAVVESRDAANNAVTSSEFSWTSL
jgi:peptidoglycan hydrolase-like protein with peptidoglycan-binding domain